MTDQTISDAWQGKAVDQRNSARGIIVTIPQMAQFLGCATKHVRELIEAGAPIHERGGRAGGKAHQLNSHDFMQWRDAWRDSQKLGRPKGPVDEAKARSSAAAASIKELELAQRRGDLFHLSDWSPFVDDRMVETRSEFVHVPGKFKEQFTEAPAPLISRMARWLNDELTGILNRMAAGLKSVPDEARAAGQDNHSRRN